MEEDQEEFKPRSYQEELTSITKERNTIIYLPTGSGKTFIALMLIKEMSSGLENGKHTFFMVNTVTLVSQQVAYIRRHSRFPVGAYSGDMKVDFWTGAKWQSELDKHKIMVMTSQIFLNLLQSSYIRLEDVNLLIFDECHHGVNDQPMRQIMQQFERCPVEMQPRILGLSATLLNSNVKASRVSDEVVKLETTFQSCVATCNDMANVCFFSTNPTESLASYETTYDLPGVDVLNYGLKLISECIEFLLPLNIDTNGAVLTDIPADAQLLNDNQGRSSKGLRNLLKDVVVHINMLGLYGGSKACLAHITQLERQRLKADNLMTKMVLTLLITTLTVVRKLFEDRMSDCTVKSQIWKYSSYKMLTLLEILKKYMPPNEPAVDDNNRDDMHQKKEKFCCIIFVERRFTAKSVYFVLKALSKEDSDFQHISPDFIVGFNNNPFNDTREAELEKKWASDCLERFRSGQTNVLVASNVLEEGMDIQTCNLVVRFDIPKNYCSYIQSKGRARHRTSNYVVMMENGTFRDKYQEYLKIEKALQDLLIGRTNERMGPTEEDIAKELYDQLIPPYVVGSSSVSLASAISLLNRYCSMLPQDLFSQLTPVWMLRKGTKRPSVYLQMPINCLLGRELILGPEMPNKKLAKRAAALEACKRLHELGELNNNLLPVGSMCKELDSSELFPLFNMADNIKVEGQSPRGSKKRKQVYPKQFPEILSHCRPKPHVDLYLHAIEMTPVYQPDPGNHRKVVFFDLLNRTEGFAILCRKPFPQICDFPIFMSVGELKVHVVPNATFVTLTSEQVELLESFNIMLFQKLLKLMKPYTMVDREDKINSYFVVPTKEGGNGHEIHWDVVKNYKTIPDIVRPSREARENLVVTKQNFEVSVVAPWYRGMLPEQQYYIVTKVSPDHTPLSPFPSQDFTSYAEYYERKYKLSIINKEQPLLEVKVIPIKNNYLRPRGVTGSTSKRRKQEQEEYEENLIPELCVKLDFPALLWLKATCLPTILHRVSQILQAEELRQKIVHDTGIGRLDLRPGETWKPLVPDVTSTEPDNSTSNHFEYSASGRMRLRSKNKPQNDIRMSLFGGDKEPIDIERNLEDVTVVELLGYDEFIRKPMFTKTSNSPTAGNSHEDVLLEDADDWESVPLKLISSKPEDIGPQQCEVLQALTSASANDIVNLERLETLGDSYLKFMASLFLFLHLDKMDEGKLTEIKSKMIGNRNLYYSGVHHKLSGYLKVQDFGPGDWTPPGIHVHPEIQQALKASNASPKVLYDIQLSPEEQLSGVLTEETLNLLSDLIEQLGDDKIGASSFIEHFLCVQTVSDKSIADCVEALIGAYLKGSGIRGALELLIWLKVLPESATPENIFDVKPPTADLKFLRLQQRGDIQLHLSDKERVSLENRLKYTFKDPSYLLQALTHASYSQNIVTNCYQRLEFLGDAVLDFLITCHIYENCGIYSPGELTDLRSALVNNVTFASIAVRNGFHKYLKYTTNKLMDMIDRFVKLQEDNGHAINEEVLFYLEEEEVNIAEYVEVPKALGDLFESIAGAIYLDSGYNLEEVWRVYYRLMRKEIKNFSEKIPIQPVRLLYESTEVSPKFFPSKVLESGVVMVYVEVIVDNKKQYFYGFGDSKFQAKRAAAKFALKKIAGDYGP